MFATRIVLSLAMLSGTALALEVIDMEKATTRPTTQPAGNYVCPMCHTSSDKPGKCPDCGMEMKKASEIKKDKKHPGH